MHEFDVRKFGPGMWFMIHRQARRAVTPMKKEIFIDEMEDLMKTHRCGTCGPHMIEFNELHPIRDYYMIINAFGEDIGMFKWTWELHNDVNERLGKPTVPFDIAYAYYKETKPEGVCTGAGPDKKVVRKRFS